MPRYIFGSPFSGDQAFFPARTPQLQNRDDSSNQFPSSSTLTQVSASLRGSSHPFRSPLVPIRNNGYGTVVVNGNPITPNERRDHVLPSNYPHSIHRRVILPSHRNENLVYSSVHWKWRTKQGKELDKALMFSIKDEMEKPKTGVVRSKQKIDLELMGRLIWALISFVYVSRFLKTRAEALVKCIFHLMVDLYPEYFKDVLLRESRSYIRKHVMVAYKLQRTIDIQPTGGLNYGCIESIRKGVEELSKYEQGVMPSSQTVARCARELEAYASVEEGLGIVETKTAHGPVFSFDMYQFIRQLMKGFGLVEHAKTGSNSDPVMICWTLDFAQLTRELGHLTGGLKIVDPRALDPLTGNLLLLEGKFQSRDLSFPCQLAFVKDSKMVYKDCFKSFFELLNMERLVVPGTDTFPEMSNFEVSSCQDLASGWKTTALGGGCKTTEYFCPQCMVSRRTIGSCKLDSDRCDLCIKVGNVKCYCHEVVDEYNLEETRKKLTNYIEKAFDYGFTRFDRIGRQSRLVFDPNHANKESNKLHIEFEPRSRKEKTCYITLLNAELEIRLEEPEHSQRLKNLIMLPLDEKRDALREFGLFEASIQLARLTVNRHDAAREAAIALVVEKLIPCILHMKMRVVEKVFHTIINMALERYGDSKVDKAKKKLLVSNIELCMQHEVVGDEIKNISSQWKFRWAEPSKGSNGKTSMEKPNLTGNQSQKVINKLSRLSEVLFNPDLDEDTMTDEEEKTVRNNNRSIQSKWDDIANNLTALWKLIEQHDDYTDKQIDELHFHSTQFMSQWIDLMGPQHVTNYIHVIGSGHVTYFAAKYRNLYRFSQQGWEALNQLLKHYYFNNTNHGGSAGNGGKNSVGLYVNGTICGDHCRPLMRLCQRSMMWKLGLGDAYFQKTMSNCEEQQDLSSSAYTQLEPDSELEDTTENDDMEMQCGEL